MAFDLIKFSTFNLVSHYLDSDYDSDGIVMQQLFILLHADDCLYLCYYLISVGDHQHIAAVSYSLKLH